MEKYIVFYESNNGYCHIGTNDETTCVRIRYSYGVHAIKITNIREYVHWNFHQALILTI